MLLPWKVSELQHAHPEAEHMFHKMAGVVIVCTLTWKKKACRVGAGNGQHVFSVRSVNTLGGKALMSTEKTVMPTEVEIRLSLLPCVFTMGNTSLSATKSPSNCITNSCYIRVCSFCVRTCIYSYISSIIAGARGGAVGWGTALQVGRPQVRFPMVSLEFFIDIIIPGALWPWGWLSL